MSYAHYQQQTASKIKRLRRDLDNDNAQWIIQANTPFELIPPQPETKRGMLLIHGLLDSPFTMHDLGEFYQSQGFLTRGILLDGHGTIPEQLKDIEYQQWIDNVSVAIKSLRKVVDEVYITGFSTGGLLALHHCLHDSDIKGVITLCPALKLNTIVTIGTQFFVLAKRLVERDYWYVDTEVIDPTKYNQLPINAVHQVVNLSAEFEKLNKNLMLNVPLCMVATEDDETIQGNECLSFFNQQHHPFDRMIYYSNNETYKSTDTLQIIRPNDPEQRILDYSHIAVPISPNNCHYGLHGDYQQPIHYRDKKNQTVYKGALSKNNLQHYNVQRLSYNPKFNDMCNAIKNFLSLT